MFWNFHSLKLQKKYLKFSFAIPLALGHDLFLHFPTPPLLLHTCGELSQRIFEGLDHMC